MTSRERVLAAFDHVEPDRVPAWCGASPEFWEKAKRELGLDDEGLRVRFGDDFRRVHARYGGPKPPLSPGATCRTVFGVERHGMGYGQPLSHPLANAGLAEIHEYPWPSPGFVDPYGIPAEADKYNGQYAILGGDWSPFWHDAIDLLGMENLCVKMFEEPQIADAVFQHIVDYYVAVNQRILNAASHVNVFAHGQAGMAGIKACRPCAPMRKNTIDILFIGNDLGGQTGPLVGERLFRRFLLPHLKRLIDLGHAYGLKVMLHCCGGFAPLIPPLVEAGLDGLHAVQSTCGGMELARLKADFGDKILFNGGVDSHHILIKGTPGFVRAKTREVLKIMMPGGGFVAGATHDTILEETPVENVVAMFDAVREFGRYR